MVIATQTVTKHCTPMTTKPESLLPPHVAQEMRPERIGYRLSLLRKAKGLKPSEMADALGIERTYWSRFENGKRALTDPIAALLVERFDVTMDFLILGRWGKLPSDLADELRSVEAKKS